MERESIVDGVLGDNCTLGTQGKDAHGGFGAGFAKDFSGVINTVVINSRLRVNDSSARAGIGVGTIDNTLVRVGGSIACNTTVNDKMFADGCGRIDLRVLVNSSDIQPGHHRCSPALPEPTTPPVVLPEPATPSVVVPASATASVVLPAPTSPAIVLPGLGVLPSAPPVSTVVLPEPATPSVVLPEPATPSVMVPASATPSAVMPAPTSPAVVLPGLDVLPSAPPVPTTAATADVVPPGVLMLSPTVISIVLASSFTAALGGLVCYLFKRGSARQTGADGSQGRENGSGTGRTVRHSEDQVMV